MVFRLHFSKQTEPQGLPWIIRGTDFSQYAAHVIFDVPTETEEAETGINNIRYFIRAEGEILWEGDVARIVKAA